MSCHPIALVIFRQQICTQLHKDRLKSFHLFRHKKKIPDTFAANLLERISSGQFAGSIESRDSTLGIENDNQRSYRVENRGHHVALLMQSFLRMLQIRDIKG